MPWTHNLLPRSSALSVIGSPTNQKGCVITEVMQNNHGSGTLRPLRPLEDLFPPLAVSSTGWTRPSIRTRPAAECASDGHAGAGRASDRVTSESVEKLAMMPLKPWIVLLNGTLTPQIKAASGKFSEGIRST